MREGCRDSGSILSCPRTHPVFDIYLVLDILAHGRHQCSSYCYRGIPILRVHPRTILVLGRSLLGARPPRWDDLHAVVR